MGYWKGLAIAAVIDLVWIMGCPITATEPDPRPPVEAVLDLGEISRLEDSLMTYLQAHPDDVDAIQKLADVYSDHGWHEAALRPLARAVQLDPSRRSLWVALDRAIEQSGRVQITDAELTRKAQDFVEAVEMWGHGC